MPECWTIESFRSENDNEEEQEFVYLVLAAKFWEKVVFTRTRFTKASVVFSAHQKPLRCLLCQMCPSINTNIAVEKRYFSLKTSDKQSKKRETSCFSSLSLTSFPGSFVFPLPLVGRPWERGWLRLQITRARRGRKHSTRPLTDKTFTTLWSSSRI